MAQSIRSGTIVRHPGLPELGPGKVLEIAGNRATIYFKEDAQEEFRKFSLQQVQFEVCEVQTDAQLDNLPPLVGGRFPVSSKRVKLEHAIPRFTEIFPQAFEDPRYIGEGKLGPEAYGERAYKWNAHERYVEQLGNGRGRALLEQGQIDKLRQDTVAVATQNLNLLSPSEALAFKDGLSADSAKAEAFLRALFDLVEHGGVGKELFETLARTLQDLPLQQGKSRAATWPVLTILPSLADPTRFICVQPTQMNECAARLRFDIQYSPALRWVTYRKVLDMSEMILERLRPLGARDYIDAQSFMWVIEKY
jgi:hypothetical protein